MQKWRLLASPALGSMSARFALLAKAKPCPAARGFRSRRHHPLPTLPLGAASCLGWRIGCGLVRARRLLLCVQLRPLLQHLLTAACELRARHQPPPPPMLQQRRVRVRRRRQPLHHATSRHQAVRRARLADCSVQRESAPRPRLLSASMPGDPQSMLRRHQRQPATSALGHRRPATSHHVPHLHSGSLGLWWPRLPLPFPTQAAALVPQPTLVLCPRAGGVGSMRPLPSGPLAACRLATRARQEWCRLSVPPQRCARGCWQQSTRSLPAWPPRARLQAVTWMQRSRRLASSGAKRRQLLRQRLSATRA